MISIFRHHLQGRLLRYTIYFISFLVAFPMVLTLFMRFFDPEHGQWAIKVNGKSISLPHYQERLYEFEQQIEQFKRMLGPQADRFLAMQGWLSDPSKLVVGDLVTQKLFSEVAHSQAFYLSPTFVTQYFLHTLPKELITPDGTVDAQRLAQMRGVSIDQLRQRTQQQLQQQVLGWLAQGAEYVPQFQLRQAYIAHHAKRSFNVATFTYAQLIAHSKRATITAQDVQLFFESENKKNRRYWVPEQRTASVWEFDADHYGLAINDEQIKKYYDRNKYQKFVDHQATLQVRAIVVPVASADARTRLSSLRQELIKNPTLFAQKAREISVDASKKDGGLMPAFSRGSHEPAFERAAFALVKAGDISEIVQTKRGLEILQLVSKNAQTYKPLEKVRETIVKALRGERFAQFFGFEAKRALAQENKEQALTDFAQRKGGKKRVAQLTANDKQTAAYQQKIFVLGKGGGATVVEGEKGYLVLVTDIAKTYKPTLQAVQEQVTRDLTQSRAQQELRELASACQKHSSQDSFEQFVREHGGRVTETGMLDLNDEKQTAALRKQLGAAFEQVKGLAVPGTCTMYSASDAYLVQLARVAPFEEQQFESQKPALTTQLDNEQKGLLERTFVASLFKNATIKVNEQLIK